MLEQAEKLVLDFVKGELDEMGYQVSLYASSHSHDAVYLVDVMISQEHHPDTKLDFKLTGVKIEIDLSGENDWEEVTSYDWRVKYFWMAFLG